MKKRTSRAIRNELAQGADCLAGLNKEGEALGVVANSGTLMTGVFDNALKTNNEYHATMTASLAATVALREQVDLAGKYISVVRDNLKPKLGSRFTQAWAEVGFFTRNLQVPRPAKDRATLLQAIEMFFDSHPELEIPLVMTKAMTTAMHTALAAAIAASSDAKVLKRQKRDVRDAAMETLHQRIQALRAELKPLLAADDPRWLDFGFNVPADVHVTSAPEDVKLTLDPVTGHVVASWGHTVHTDHFRVYKRVIGTDTEYQPVDTTTETSFDLGTFASGAHLDVQVTAINSAGESVPSDVASIALP